MQVATPSSQAPPASNKARHGGRRALRNRGNHDEACKQNEAFEQYYKAQQIVADDEFEVFLESMRRPLPVVIRVNRTKSIWKDLEESLKEDPRWTPIPWADSCWQCQADDFDDALRTQCSALNKAYALRFQEAASLLPPLLADLRPNSSVLDMCAAPGSKTLESLELMREGNSNDEGIIVANDADAERCLELLPLITRKAQHPGTAVILGSATKFPAQFGPDGQQALFDRVICDVPCSGDGTMRKRPEMWEDWDSNYALSLHHKQVNILSKGLCLLKPGGRLVYSTCSLNPIENEAVVLAVLNRFGKDIGILARGSEGLDELVSRGLKQGPGLTTWKVPNPSANGDFCSSWEATEEGQRRPKGLLEKTMFPDQGQDSGVTEDLKRCIRLMPHDIDGSGFFVTVFEKFHHREPAKLLLEEKQPSSNIPRALPWRARNAKNRYEVLTGDTEELLALKAFYGLQELPSPLLAEYNVKGRLTQLNLINDALLKFLQCKLNNKASPLLVAVGVPLFKIMNEHFMTNIDVPSRWRPALEGCSVLGPRMTKRCLRLDLPAFQTLLATRLLPMAQLRQMEESKSMTGLDSCEDLLGGCVVGLFDGSFWAPCIITGLGLELYGSLEELGEPRPRLLTPPRATLIQEGAGYVALDKPSGLRTEDALKQLRLTHGEAELVSRLDKGTSGCLIVASNKEGAACLTEQFASQKVAKTYFALVWGRVASDEGSIQAALSLTQTGGKSRYRAYIDNDLGKPSETQWKVLARGDQTTLVSASPLTGRTHQIRCHFAHIGHPLVGDSKYGGAPAAYARRLPLHCAALVGLDAEGQAFHIASPLPEDFEQLLDEALRDGVEPSNWRDAIAACDAPSKN